MPTVILESGAKGRPGSAVRVIAFGGCRGCRGCAGLRFRVGGVTKIEDRRPKTAIPRGRGRKSGGPGAPKRPFRVGGVAKSIYWQPPDRPPLAAVTLYLILRTWNFGSRRAGLRFGIAELSRNLERRGPRPQMGPPSLETAIRTAKSGWRADTVRTTATVTRK